MEESLLSEAYTDIFEPGKVIRTVENDFWFIFFLHVVSVEAGADNALDLLSEKESALSNKRTHLLNVWCPLFIVGSSQSRASVKRRVIGRLDVACVTVRPCSLRCFLCRV